jgi:hypothetical protein
MDVLYRALSMAKNQWQHIPSELLRMFAQPLDNDSRVADEKVKRDACLSQLVEMGYSMDIAASAYDNCGSDKSVSSVVTWILERQENAGKTVNVGIDAVLQSEHNRVDAGAMYAFDQYFVLPMRRYVSTDMILTFYLYESSHAGGLRKVLLIWRTFPKWPKT